MTIKEIAEKLGLNPFAFTSYLQTWHREDVFARRGAEYREGAILSQTKQYKKPTAAKYAPAIERLRAENRPTSEIAAEFGLHPEVFRQYLKEHEPELYARQGMMRASNGRSVSRRSMEKYAEALRFLRNLRRGAEIHRPAAGAELQFAGRVHPPQLSGADPPPSSKHGAVRRR